MRTNVAKAKIRPPITMAAISSPSAMGLVVGSARSGLISHQGGAVACPGKAKGLTSRGKAILKRNPTSLTLKKLMSQ
jgi:hypothetical protein